MSEASLRTVAVTTLGCKVNQCESAAISACFEERGLKVVPFGAAADIYVINTCAVTAKAGAQSRQLIRRALRANPEGKVVVTGCYAQVAGPEVREMAGREVCLVGNDSKHLLVPLALAEGGDGRGPCASDLCAKRLFDDLPARRLPGRTRGYLKIQDGCDNFCSYCIVPHARGRARSLAPERVLAKARELAAAGCRELVLTGIHVGMYGQDLTPRASLLSLARRLAGQTEGPRYRISSLEPGEVSRELLALMAQAHCFMPHFHLPLQSGAPEVLRRMNRRYTVADFVRVVEMILATLPEAAIGLDVLTGFPGEGEAEFEQTVKLIEGLEISYLHVFPYSRRPGTPAALMPAQVPGPVKEERAARLLALGQEKRRRFYARQQGALRRVLAEGRDSRSKLMRGFAENYVPVCFQADPGLAGQVVEVRIEEVRGLEVFGRLI